MRYPLSKITLVASILLTAILACNVPIRGSSRPPTVAPMSAEELQQLEDNLKATLDASFGEITITLTEQQINSMLTTALSEQGDQFISDSAVRLTNGLMEIYGKLTQGPVKVDLKVVMKPGVNISGVPSLDIVEMKMGGLPVPADLQDRIGSLVDSAIQEYLSSQNQGFKATEITIGEGTMTVSGNIQQP